MGEKIQLTVAPILKQKYVGNNVARINREIMDKLKVKEGHILEIKPKNPKKVPKEMAFYEKTSAIVQQIKRTEDSDTIRLDRFVRDNIRTLIEEKVKVEKASVEEAEKIKILPLGLPESGNSLVLPVPKGRPVCENELVTLTEIENHEFEWLSFIVQNTKPEGIVLITENTDVEISGKNSKM